MRKIPLSAGVVVLLLNGSALAQQPLAFPMRSQSPAQTSIDTATCYSYANQHTGVNMARQSQAPEKPTTTKPAAAHQVAVAAPLPSAMAPGSAPVAASMVATSGTPTPGVAADAPAAAHATSTSAAAPKPPLP